MLSYFNVRVIVDCQIKNVKLVIKNCMTIDNSLFSLLYLSTSTVQRLEISRLCTKVGT